MKEKLEHLAKLLEEVKADIDKFEERNNRSAGLRVRKKMLEVKNTAQEIRKYILDKRKVNI